METGERLTSLPADGATVTTFLALDDGTASVGGQKAYVVLVGAARAAASNCAMALRPPCALQVVTGGHEGKLLVWNFDDGGGRIVRRLTGHQQAIWRLARLPSGHIASASEDKVRACLPVLPSQRQMQGLQSRRPARVARINFFPLQTLRIWNPYTGDCVQLLESPIPVYCVASSDDGILFSAGQREELDASRFPITRWAPRP